MEESLVALLLAWAPLAALAGNRIHWATRPQGTLPPFVILNRISGIRDTTFQGPSGAVASRVQADCYALTYSESKALARAMEALLSGYRGSDGSTEFAGIFLESERDGFDDTDPPDKFYRTSLDFTLWHKET